MNALGFENYVEPLKIYLQKFREVRYKVYVVKFVEKFRRGEYYFHYGGVIYSMPCNHPLPYYSVISSSKKNLFAYVHIAGT